MQAVNFWDREQPRTDWQPQRCTRSRRHLASDLAQGRVVRREARTAAKFDGVESEADMFNSWSNIITKFAAGCTSRKLRAQGANFPPTDSTVDTQPADSPERGTSHEWQY